MPRPVSADRRSNASDTDDLMQEQELKKLNRKYRKMDTDREGYTQESQGIIKKQRREILQLEKEREELLKELRLAESRQNRVRDDEHTDKLVNLSSSTDEKLSQIDNEKQKIAELDANIREWERKVKEQNMSMGGANMSRIFHQKTQKNIRVLENRLDQTTKHFNGKLTHNRDLREKIDDLRFERGKYEQLRVRLEKELEQLRKEIGEIIINSTQSYEQRDEAQQKMLTLKEKADKDKQQHESEMKELCRILDHDRKLKEFMGRKCQDRPEDPQLVEWRQRKEAREAEKKKESQEDTVESYEKAWQKIKNLTDEDNLDTLVKRFIENEDRNFALFNYVNEQNNTIELLIEDIEKTQREMDREQSHGVQLESERRDTLHHLEDQQTAARQQVEEAETNNRAVVKILDQLRAGIDSIFGKIGCDRGPIEDMLGANVGVSSENMLQYLGIIEQRTNELLAITDYLRCRDQAVSGTAVGVTGAGAGAGNLSMLNAAVGGVGTGTRSQLLLLQTAPALNPPSLLQDEPGGGAESAAITDNDDDTTAQSDVVDDTKPFSRDDLQKKATKNVSRREAVAPSGGGGGPGRKERPTGGASNPNLAALANQTTVTTTANNEDNTATVASGGKSVSQARKK